MSVRGEIPVGPIREAVEAAVAGGDSWSQIAYRAGWPKGGKEHWKMGCTSTLKRRVGIFPTRSGNKREKTSYFTKNLQYGTALRIVRAIDGDPVEFGL